jgi:predicted N-acyltransferase
MPNLSVHASLQAIPAADWNRLVDGDAPFLRYEFLAAMERHGCVGERLGWIPQHLALHEQGELVAAAPAYLKHNSYGELVFDWSWADAYHRAGLRYYPKLVVASPYTPANGPRLLVADGPKRDAYRHALANAVREHAEQLRVSSVHWLFTTDEETSLLERQGLLRRMGCQFHWENHGYRDFEDFLARFSSEKRKKIRRERRRVAEAGIRFQVCRGHAASEAQWAAFHRLYASTFDRRGGIATLSLPFFQDIAEAMGGQVLLVLAYRGERLVAAALDLIGSSSLFGRHWGCCEDYHSLHFEACYYQGLQYCIDHGLTRFEPGAQGEHKISRGFLPTPTWSAHWIADPRFRMAIAQFLHQETAAMSDYLDEMRTHSPYKAANAMQLAS